MQYNVKTCSRVVACFALLTALLGCGSTPKRDDYAKHVNTLERNEAFRDIPLALVNPSQLDLRGIYDYDTTTTGTSMLYDGSAGLIGVALQAGIHASLTSSARSSQLADQQMAANSMIAELIDSVSSISTRDLVNIYTERLVDASDTSSDTLMLRPIFFSNDNMDEISLKLVAWIPGRTPKHPRYQNLVHIYGAAISRDTTVPFTDIEQSQTQDYMSKLLESAITVVLDDITGNYDNGTAQAKTFIVKQNDSSQVIRGRLMSSTCDYQVVKNLREWFVLLPKKTENANNQAPIPTC